MELSLLRFLPIFVSNRVSIEGIIKYILVQSGGSAIFLIGIIIIKAPLVIMSILVKLGLFPFYFWVPTVIVRFNWIGCMLLRIFQKIRPIVILIKTDISCIVLYRGRISIFLRNFLALNQTNTKSLIAYSSISHTGWIALGTCMSNNITFFYIITYFWTTLFIFKAFNNSNNYSILHFETIPRGSKLAIINLIGIPPFSIFFIKLIIFKFLTDFIVIILVLVGTLFSALIYLTFLIPSFMGTSNFRINSRGKVLPLVFLPLVILF